MSRCIAICCRLATIRSPKAKVRSPKSWRTMPRHFNFGLGALDLGPAIGGRGWGNPTARGQDGVILVKVILALILVLGVTLPGARGVAANPGPSPDVGSGPLVVSVEKTG